MKIIILFYNWYIVASFVQWTLLNSSFKEMCKIFELSTFQINKNLHDKENKGSVILWAISKYSNVS